MAKWFLILPGLCLPAFIAGCGATEWTNFITPLNENGTGLNVLFVNETPYSISTFWGVYHPYDLSNSVVAKPISLAGSARSPQAVSVPNRRRLDVAGAALRQAAQVARPSGIDPAQITNDISFINPADNTTVGTAPGKSFYLGVDYSNNDNIEIHFKSVPGTTNQFVVEAFASPAAQ
jgi:hypothetical protein